MHRLTEMRRYTDNPNLPTAPLEHISIPALISPHSPAEAVAIVIATMCKENGGAWAGYTRIDIQTYANKMGVPSTKVATGISAMRAASQVDIQRGETDAFGDIIFPRRPLVYLLFAATPIAS